ncbi:MAG TPA: sigma-70 family RNA polymerase sigma factor [Solirubrobacteraceae bacterium]|jgi:RNA polymerase sigma-70 factor (ECF subfamily)|nr:sigma-70 family RNA polymerase sigma factor [Solirubrobacteraceae bacterium]
MRGLRRDPLEEPEALIERVYAYVAYRIGQGPDAEDVTGETFARAVRYRDSYDASKGAPITWLIGIAQRCVSESYGRPRVADQPPDRAAPESMEADALERLTVRTAVAQLGDRDRELIALRYGADLSTRQIAERMETNTNAIDVALHRARARLRELLGDDDAVAS